MKIERVRRSAALAMLVCLGLSTSAKAGFLFFYKFTSIADTGQKFPFQSLSNAPAIDSDAKIAFHGVLAGSNFVEGVFTRHLLEGIGTLSDSVSTIYNGGYPADPSINLSGQAAFLGMQIDPPAGTFTALLRGEGNSATPILTTSFNSGKAVESICGNQMNVQQNVAFLAMFNDGHSSVLVQGGEGGLTGVIRVVATDRAGAERPSVPVFDGINCAPSIIDNGTVAFAARSTDGVPGIFTSSSTGVVTNIVSAGDFFAGFDDVAMAGSGAIAFNGSLQSQGPFTQVLYRFMNGTLTKVADTALMGADIPFSGFSINDAGQVAFAATFGGGFSSAVYRGPGGLFGRVIGSGDQLFGRTVAEVFIGREALNSFGQLALLISFTDGSQMIARGDPVSRLFQFPFHTLALQLATGRAMAASVSTPVPVRPVLMSLSFDAIFLAAGSALEVKLGDAVIGTVSGSEPGVQRHVSMSLDLRKRSKAKIGAQGPLRFSLKGKPGASIRIANLEIPGVFSDRMQSESLGRWKADAGLAAMVNTTRLPVKIAIAPVKGELVSVTLSSGDGFDATTDIDRATLRLAGSKVRSCRAADADKSLVCDFEIKGLAAHDAPLELQASTPYGWGITGSATVHTL
jgi:hypothetical protein